VTEISLKLGSERGDARLHRGVWGAAGFFALGFVVAIFAIPERARTL
jgi:hypothetical protein